MSAEPPADHDYSSFAKDPAWESEFSVFAALEKLGWEPVLIGIYDDIFRLTRDLRRIDPEFIFNMSEAFQGRRDLAAQLAGLLELLKIPYTGAQSFSLGLCQDKNLSKKIMAHHHIRVPRWVTSHAKQPLRGLKTFAYPAFVKPAREEASEGISRESFVENEKDCLDRVRYLHERYRSDVVIEEFISGRELYASCLGEMRPKVFPIRELTFRQFPEDVPKFATFKTKWDEEYRKKWGIRNEFARNLSEDIQSKIEKTVKKAFSVLELSGFARFDLRLSETGEVVLLEANPNPSLGADDDFVLSAQKGGMDFISTIEKIVQITLDKPPL